MLETRVTFFSTLRVVKRTLSALDPFIEVQANVKT